MASAAAVLAAVALEATRLPAQTVGEYDLKAAFLYKFAGFVEWPATSGNVPLCIGVAGKDPFGSALDEVVKGKSINGRAFRIERLKLGQESAGCQIVFISSSEKARLRSILERLRGSAVLTVGDTPGFCDMGGIINMELAGDHVRLQVNLEAAERAHLQLSSRLLSLSTIVRSAGQ